MESKCELLCLRRTPQLKWQLYGLSHEPYESAIQQWNKQKFSLLLLLLLLEIFLTLRCCGSIVSWIEPGLALLELNLGHVDFTAIATPTQHHLFARLVIVRIRMAGVVEHLLTRLRLQQLVVVTPRTLNLARQ